MRPPNGSSPFEFSDAFFSYRIKTDKNTHSSHNACHSTASLNGENQENHSLDNIWNTEN